MRLNITKYKRYQENRKSIGYRCRMLRKINNLKTADVAKDIGVTSGTVNKFETGLIDSYKCFCYYFDKYGKHVFHD